MVSGRFALLECLFSNPSGSLFRAEDILRQTQVLLQEISAGPQADADASRIYKSSSTPPRCYLLREEAGSSAHGAGEGHDPFAADSAGLGGSAPTRAIEDELDWEETTLWNIRPGLPEAPPPPEPSSPAAAEPLAWDQEDSEKSSFWRLPAAPIPEPEEELEDFDWEEDEAEKSSFWKLPPKKSLVTPESGEDRDDLPDIDSDW